MAIPGTTTVLSPIAPGSVSDQYPTHLEEHGQGGYRTVNTITERNNIPMARRKEGMLVKVLADKITYTLDGGLNNPYWKVAYSITTTNDTEGTITFAGGSNHLWEVFNPTVDNLVGCDISYIVRRGGQRRNGSMKVRAEISGSSVIYLSFVEHSVWGDDCGVIFSFEPLAQDATFIGISVEVSSGTNVEIQYKISRFNKL